MRRFRQFIKEHSFPLSLREDEAAPALGSGAEAPSDPQDSTTNKHHPEVIGREFGIEDEDFSAALEGDAVTLYGTKIPDFGWGATRNEQGEIVGGFRVAGPIHVSVEDRGDGSYNVTFPLKEMYSKNRKIFIHRYKEGENPYYWDGPVEDQTEVMTLEQLMDAYVAPFASMNDMGAAMGGMGGGMDPMGGGMMGGM